MKTRLFLGVLAIGSLIVPDGRGAAQDFPYQVFERYAEALAQQIGMPGLSAVITRNGNVEWRRGYGYADAENRTPVTADTPFAIGGATQGITGVLIGMCVDRHQLSVEQAIRDYVPSFPQPASIRHVLAHASTGRFVYDPLAFSALTAVVEKCMGMSFRHAVATQVLDPLTMANSVPGMDLAGAAGFGLRALFPPSTGQHYEQLLQQLATPYRIRQNRPSRTEYPSYGIDAAGGLVASAEDLATFEKKIDDRDNIPLDRNTLETMWTQQTVDLGNQQTASLPTGLGWFVQYVSTETQFVSREKLVWTFGHIPDAGSALIVKMPSKNLTLVMLSNSGGLAAGYNFEQGDVTASPFVKVFLKLFI
jgi:CubicO group peptidase (beta-lactamase class C family)